MRLYLSILVFCVINTTFCAQSSSQERGDKSSLIKEKILYSSDDSVCRIFSHIYDEVIEKWGEVGAGWIWEDAHRTEFVKQGLVPIMPSFEGNEDVFEEGRRKYLYSEKLEEDFSQILIEDTQFGKESYSTNVFVFDGKLEFTTSDYSRNHASIGIVFGKKSDIESGRVVTLPYFFNKNNVRSEYSKVYKLDGEDVYKISNDDVGLYKGVPVIQRAFKYEGRVFFSARQLGLALIYKISNKDIDDVCYIGNFVEEIQHK